jgi:hypothetical protein
MNKRAIAGWLLTGLVALALIGAGQGKLLGTAPPEIFEQLASAGLTEETKLIGVGAILTALALLVPHTLSIGVLLASAYWGGAILVHMGPADDSYLVPAVLLIVTWAGAWLREPAVMASFWRFKKAETDTAA